MTARLAIIRQVEDARRAGRHAPVVPGRSETAYLPSCWCQDRDGVWPCPDAPKENADAS